MKITVADKEDYIRFNARISDKLNTFELTENATNYIIHRVGLEDNAHDFSLICSCINNLLDEQYEKRQYIKLEEIQEIDKLAKTLNKEECKILNAYAEVKRYTVKDLKEIKKLIADVDNYQIVEAHNLHELGVLIAQKISAYHMNLEVTPFVDFEKLASTYLLDAGIKENFCSYGLLVDTRDMLKNDLIQAKADEDKVLKIEVVNKKEFENSQIYSRVIIYLPESKEILKEKFKQIKLDYDKLTAQDTYVTKCEIVNFSDEILEGRFNKAINYEVEKFLKAGYSVPFNKMHELYEKVKKFDNISMCKFLALEYTKSDTIKNINDLINCTKQISNYNILPQVSDYNDMGRYLVNETGHFDEVSLLEDYIDYDRLARDYTKNGCVYSGEFTEYGYLMEKESKEEIENKNIDFEDEKEI